MKWVKWNGKKLKDAASKAAKVTLVEVASRMVRDSKVAAPRGVSGHLRRSISMGPVESIAGKRGAGAVRVQVGFMRSAEADTDSIPYGVHVIYGRRPGRKPPPSRELELWVRRIVKPKPPPVSRAKSRNVRRARRLLMKDRTEQLIRSVAFLIARKIGREGQPGKIFMHHAFHSNKDRVLPTYHANYAKFTTSMPKPGSK